jgi:hypothetical protein
MHFIIVLSPCKDVSLCVVHENTIFRNQGDDGVDGGGMSKQNNDLLITVQANKRPLKVRRPHAVSQTDGGKRYSRSVPVSSPIYTTQRVSRIIRGHKGKGKVRGSLFGLERL